MIMKNDKYDITVKTDLYFDYDSGMEFYPAVIKNKETQEEKTFYLKGMVMYKNDMERVLQRDGVLDRLMKEGRNLEKIWVQDFQEYPFISFDEKYYGKEEKKEDPEKE